MKGKGNKLKYKFLSVSLLSGRYIGHATDMSINRNVVV